MGSLLLALVMVAVLAMVVYGVVVMLSGDDPGLGVAEPDGRARPLPTNRSLAEADLKAVRFDTALRGYRMAQVDRALRRTAYDLGYKDEMIAVLEAEVIALREGRTQDAELLRTAREAASDTSTASTLPASGSPAAGGLGAPESGAQESGAPESGAPESGAAPSTSDAAAQPSPAADGYQSRHSGQLRLAAQDRVGADRSDHARTDPAETDPLAAGQPVDDVPSGRGGAPTRRSTRA